MVFHALTLSGPEGGVENRGRRDLANVNVLENNV